VAMSLLEIVSLVFSVNLLVFSVNLLWVRIAMISDPIAPIVPGNAAMTAIRIGITFFN
jgi:hypothetical protein